jgi:hypothetical protein
VYNIGPKIGEFERQATILHRQASVQIGSFSGTGVSVDEASMYDSAMLRSTEIDILLPHGHFRLGNWDILECLKKDKRALQKMTPSLCCAMGSR